MRVSLDIDNIIEVATASPIHCVQGAVFCCLQFNAFVDGWGRVTEEQRAEQREEQRRRWLAALKRGQQWRREREERQQAENARRMRMTALALFAAQPIADPDLEQRIQERIQERIAARTALLNSIHANHED